MSRTRLLGPGNSRQVSGEPKGSDHLPRTALPVLRGVPSHLGAHVQRLEAGAAALGWPVDWLDLARQDLEGWLLAGHPKGGAALRLVLHPVAALLSARLEPLPAAPDPCRLAPMPHPMGGRRQDPILTHKGLAGPWGAVLLAQVRPLGAQDALLQWPDGTLAETTLASVGIETGGFLLIPPPQGRVASLTERLDLPGWARSRGLQVEVAELRLSMLSTGSLWCMNALRGFWPATLL